jgi:hypothetical protein
MQVALAEVAGVEESFCLVAEGADISFYRASRILSSTRHIPCIRDRSPHVQRQGISCGLWGESNLVTGCGGCQNINEPLQRTGERTSDAHHHSQFVYQRALADWGLAWYLRKGLRIEHLLAALYIQSKAALVAGANSVDKWISIVEKS